MISGRGCAKPAGRDQKIAQVRRIFRGSRRLCGAGCCRTPPPAVSSPGCRVRARGGSRGDRRRRCPRTSGIAIDASASLRAARGRSSDNGAGKGPVLSPQRPAESARPPESVHGVRNLPRASCLPTLCRAAGPYGRGLRRRRRARLRDRRFRRAGTTGSLAATVSAGSGACPGSNDRTRASGAASTRCATSSSATAPPIGKAIGQGVGGGSAGGSRPGSAWARKLARALLRILWPAGAAGPAGICIPAPILPRKRFPFSPERALPAVYWRPASRRNRRASASTSTYSPNNTRAAPTNQPSLALSTWIRASGS